MLFCVLLFAPILCVLFAIFLCVVAGEDAAALGTSLTVISFIGPFIAFCSWSNHASDLAKIHAQEPVIQVQEERIASLTDRLDTFNYPDKPGISLDADSPWATIVNQLSEAENALAEAKTERAVAARSVEARRNGPMSGVVG